MGRLAEYMAELSRLLGERDSVIFRGLESGNTVLVHRIEREAAPKVKARVTKMRTGDGPHEAMRAYGTINRLLREDDAVGVLREKKNSAAIIRFPGREEAEEEFASVRQYRFHRRTRDLGRRGRETAHITLESEGHQVSRIYTTRQIAKALGSRLFEPVRLHGRGKWSRDSEGGWSLVNFKAESSEPLVDEPLSAVLGRLREFPAEWMDDAYGELGALRNGPSKRAKRNGGH